ncbi:MAG TPA: hypothetical protein GXX20_09675 [Clostridiaceae bacterium]|nr:hypothetical protein [Clostridiaceae bacterium]
MKDIRNSMGDARFYMKDTRGSVTLEAAIALPVFICVIISVTFLIRVVHINESINYALNGAANELAASSYLYHVSRIEELEKLPEDAIENMVDGMAEGILGSTDDLPEELKTLVKNIIKGNFEDLKTEICIPIVKLYFKKYLPDFPLGNLDFSHSSFFEEDTGDIDIIVRYNVNIPLPVKIPQIIFTQRASVKAWLGGDEKENSPVTGEIDNIWSLSNFERGRKIREIFGANLPYNFPVLSKFEGGKATVIKSMDLTADTYKTPEMVIKKISEYMDNLAQYKGQEIPWGSSKILIMEKDIIIRELLLVIPSNEISQEIKEALDFCVIQGVNKDVILRIEKYGYSYRYDKPSKESV